MTYHFAEICRYLLFLAFTVSSISKLRSFEPFRQSISAMTENYSLRAEILTGLAISIIGLEVICALLLAPFSAFSLMGVGLSIGLLALFTFVVASVVVQRRIISCNCFGAEEKPITWVDLCRNSILLVGALFYLATIAPIFFSSGHSPLLTDISVIETVILSAVSASLLSLITSLDSVYYFMKPNP